MILVVNFHYFRDPEISKYPGIYGINQERFEKQLKFLLEHFCPISSKEIQGKDLSSFNNDNYFYITFDDGLREQYEIALPVLERYGIDATFFVNAENFVERRLSLVHKVHWVRSQMSPSVFINKCQKVISELNLNINLDFSRFVPVDGQNIYDEPETRYIKYFLNHLLSNENQELVIGKLYNDFGMNEKEHAENLYMSEEMLSHLGLEGKLGSHGYSHNVKTSLSIDSLQDDISKSKDFLMNYSSNSNLLVSYPYGGKNAVSKIVAAAHRKYGFVKGFTMERAINNCLEDEMLMCRVDSNDVPYGRLQTTLNKENLVQFLNTINYGSSWFK